MEELIIGPGNGWFYEKEIYSIKEQEKIISKTGANAFCLYPINKKRDEGLFDGNFKDYKFIACHLERVTLRNYLKILKLIEKNIKSIHSQYIQTLLAKRLQKNSFKKNFHFVLKILIKTTKKGGRLTSSFFQ